MKTFFYPICLLFLSTACAHAQAAEPNDLVQFLSGKWDNVSFEIKPDAPVLREAYAETMIVKDADTITITAHGYKDGKDLTKDMQLEVRGNEVTMRQGNFKATGKREDQVYSLVGYAEGSEYRFRLYTLGDKYVFHRETWTNGKIQQIDMSYLLRK